MSVTATLSAAIDSLILTISTPVDGEGVPRDDLIGLRVWRSTSPGFNISDANLVYNGTGLSVTIPGLTSGTTYYVKYALISEIEPDVYTVSSDLSGTPVYSSQTVDNSAPPTPTNVTTSSGINSFFIKHDIPTYTEGRGHKRTLIFVKDVTNDAVSAALPVFTDATTVANFTGTQTAITVTSGIKWRIWLKWETNDGIVSTVAAGGTNGFLLTTEVGVSSLLTAINGQISTSELTTALQTTVGTVSNLNSQYTMKINTSGQIAGFGLASTTSDSGQATSDFAIQADKFWIAPPAISSATAPLNPYHGKIWIDTSVTPNVVKYYDSTIVNTQPVGWTTNKSTVVPFSVVTTPIDATLTSPAVPVGVYMDAAFIKDGTITNAKIGTATIDKAKIASVDAATISAGVISADRIEAGSITASKINANGLSIKDAAGNTLLDAGNSALGATLFVGSGSDKRLLSTISAFSATPNINYIGESATAPAILATKNISSIISLSNLVTVTTTTAHGYLLGNSVTITGTVNFAGTYEIAEILSTTQFKFIKAIGNLTETNVGTTSSALYYSNAVYKNTTDGNTYIITGGPTPANLIWGSYLQKGVNAITPVLTNDTHIFPATNAGLITSYVGSGTEIRVFQGGTELTYDGRFTVGAADNTFNLNTWKILDTTSVSPTDALSPGTITDSGTYATVGSHSLATNSTTTDASTITYTIRGNASGTPFTLNVVQTFSKSKAGVVGTSPVIYNITPSVYALAKNSENSATSGTYSPASITVKTEKRDGNTTTRFGWISYKVDAGGLESARFNNNSADITYVPDATGVNFVTFIMYDASTGGNEVDRVTVPVSFKGANGTSAVSNVVGVLTNSDHNLPASYTGTVSSFSGSGTEIRVFQGATELTYIGYYANDAIFTASASAGQWMIFCATNNAIISGTDVSNTTLTDSGTYASTNGITTISADTGSITYTVKGKDLAGTVFSFNLTQNFTKLKAGTPGADSTIPGADAVIYELKPSTSILAKAATDAATTGTYSPATIEVAGYKTVGNGTPTQFGYVSYSVNGGTQSARGDVSSGVLQYTPAATNVSYVTFYLYSAASAGTLLDTQTVPVVFKGTPGVSAVGNVLGILSNASHFIPAAADGTTTTDSFSGSGTNIRVQQGATELTYIGSTDNLSAAAYGNGQWRLYAWDNGSQMNGTNTSVTTFTDQGTYASTNGITALSQDTGYIIYTVYGKDLAGTVFTFTLTQNFTKVKNGSNGITPTLYFLDPNALVIYKDTQNAATSGTHSSVTFNAYTQTGTTKTTNTGLTVRLFGSDGTQLQNATAGYTYTPTNGSTYTFYRADLYTGSTLVDTITIPVVYKGSTGIGTPGSRGSGQFSSNNTSLTSWSATSATSTITALGLTVVIGDRVTLTNTNTGYTETRYYNGTTSDTTQNSAWSIATQIIDGNLLVTGSVTSTQLSVTNAFIGMKIQSTDGKMVLDFANKFISIST